MRPYQRTLFISRHAVFNIFFCSLYPSLFYKTEIDCSPLVNTKPLVAQIIWILPYPSATPSWGVVGSKLLAQIKGGETYKN